MTLKKEDLVVLIEAYADAKSTKNNHLVRSMAAQLEQALDSMFPATEEVEPE